MIKGFKLNTEIEDVDSDDGSENIEVTIEHTGVSLYIGVKGYGDHGSQDGCGFPIKLELWEGKLQLLVWDDINEQDPVIIDLEKAKESNRTERQGQ